ncbi:MAG: molybdenum cofactor biosynthesis protein MoaE [Rhodospirillaceae bacterium]
MGVRVQPERFSPGAELDAFTANVPQSGAVASFLGAVRGGSVTAMTLEHYPGMTERSLAAIEAEARTRWPLDDVLVIHRHGRLLPGEPIVLVCTASAHRAAAFEACNFLMDWLKTKAPFWKKEETTQGDARWVEARMEDEARATAWEKAESSASTKA